MSKQGKMSEDRVRFFLHYRYYKSEMDDVLIRAFGMKLSTVQGLRRDNDGGFWIVCRPSQFARFLIYRDEVGIVNGFKDLNAVLVEPKQALTLAEEMAQHYGMAASFFYEVLSHVGVDGHQKSQHCVKNVDEVQVWSNPRNG